MDKVIKDGTLRVLISESTCDVILSCKDHRLMAHKLILSIASPVFRELLRKNSTDSSTVLIIPDISGAMMSLVLDYVYTGTTVVYRNSLKEFLSVANFLQIAVDTHCIETVLETLQKVEDVKKLDTGCLERKCHVSSSAAQKNGSIQDMEYCKIDVKKQDIDVDITEVGTLETHAVERETNSESKDNSKQKLVHIEPQKKLPDLLPISSEVFRKSTHRRLCNVVVPSPWCQRNDGIFLGDPRAEALRSSQKEAQKVHMEDTNNNFQLTQNCEAPPTKCSHKNLDSIIRHLYLNNLDDKKERTTNKNTNKISTSLGEDYTKTRDFSATQCSENYQKSILKSHEAFEPTSVSCSNKFQKQSESTESKLSACDKSDISNLKCTDNKTQRAFTGVYTLESPSKTNLPLDFRQNINLSRKISSITQTSPNKLPPSTILTSYSPTILNIPLSSPIKVQENLKNDGTKSVEQVDIEPNTNSNDVGNFNDVSNDNSMSNDSSNDEKREDEVHIKKKAYKCEDCEKFFSQLRNYKYHRSIHEGTKEFSAKCAECGKMFNDRGYLSSHMKIHRDRKEYACPNCPKRFNQRVAYNMHLRIHTGVKPHECSTCGKSFSRKMLLKQHQRVHTGERPYTCPECGKTFADRSNMSLHARLHTGVKPYGCTLCPKSFTKKHHLKTHMNFHTGLKPYTCENCGLAFSQSSNMRTHYKKCILKESFGKSTKTESISSAENNS